jgi:ribosomal protein S18 acetylase RimI-like enzyme
MSDDYTIITDVTGLDRIAPLWHELREHHAALSPTWRDEFLASNFEKRKAGLIAKSPGGLLVLLATTLDAAVGYCVCSIDETGRGEIDSVFVTASHRRRGIGDQLMTRAMKWFTEREAKPVTVSILAGNDDAVRLYERFGFKPRTVTHQLKP